MFKAERSRYFYKYFNLSGKTEEQVAGIFRQVDLMCNAINERTGRNIDAEEMYLMVISMVNDGNILLKEINLDELMADMEALLFNYPPMLYSATVPKVLSHIKESTTCGMNILSNTGFIKGRILRKVLAELSLDQFFDFQLYSDEAGYSKPSENFFNLMVAEAKQLQHDMGLHEIIHIGDNAVADGQGAQNIGIKHLLVHSNLFPIDNLIIDDHILLTTSNK